MASNIWYESVYVRHAMLPERHRQSPTALPAHYLEMKKLASITEPVVNLSQHRLVNLTQRHSHSIIYLYIDKKSSPTGGSRGHCRIGAQPESKKIASCSESVDRFCEERLIK